MASVRLHASLLARLHVQSLTRSAKDKICIFSEAVFVKNTASVFAYEVIVWFLVAKCVGLILMYNQVCIYASAIIATLYKQSQTLAAKKETATF